VASRADPLGATRRGPGIGGAVRAALTDFYFNSVRLVAANVIWGAAAAAVWLVSLVWPVGALILAPLLAFPTVAIFRIAARIVRRAGNVSLGDGLAAFRDYAAPAALLGVVSVAGVLILGTNAAVGLTQGEPLGWVIGTFGAWGLIVLWCGALVAWPLVVDPDRADASLRERLRLAGLLLIAFPVRFALLGIVVASIAVVSTILLAALLTISVSFIALVACHYVYPAADRLEARLLKP
jgi:uncharacterized membrane protein YesL